MGQNDFQMWWGFILSETGTAHKLGLLYRGCNGYRLLLWFDPVSADNMFSQCTSHCSPITKQFYRIQGLFKVEGLSEALSTFHPQHVEHQTLTCTLWSRVLFEGKKITTVFLSLFSFDKYPNVAFCHLRQACDLRWCLTFIYTAIKKIFGPPVFSTNEKVKSIAKPTS